MIETTTKTGNKVTLTPRSHGIDLVIHHQTLGDICGTGREYKNGSVSIRTVVNGTSREVKAEIPKSDWDAAVAAMPTAEPISDFELAVAEMEIRMEREGYGY